MPGEPGQAPSPAAAEVWPSVAPFGEAGQISASIIVLCLPVFFSWLHFREQRRQEPHVAAHSSDHRIGSGLRPRDRRPLAGARHPLRPHSARSSSAGHRWPAAAYQLADPDHQQWPPHNAQIYAAGAERGIDAATAPNGGSSVHLQAAPGCAPWPRGGLVPLIAGSARARPRRLASCRRRGRRSRTSPWAA